MPRNRDNFAAATKRLLAQRAGNRCSIPTCRAPTSGPTQDREGAVNLGEAAHITAAAPGGARYDPTLTPEQRRHADNGIWGCVKCAKLIDADESRFTVQDLRRFKADAEREAGRLAGKPKSRQSQVASVLSQQLRDQRQRLCGPVLAALDEQLGYLPHWETVAVNRNYLAQVLAPYPRPVISEKLKTVVENAAQASVTAAQTISTALDLLSRFQATINEVKQRAQDDARRHGMKDFGDEYFATVTGVASWLADAKRDLSSARDELRSYVGENVGA